MIITLKSKLTKSHYITMETDGNMIRVLACPYIGSILCEPDNERWYHPLDRTNANRTFNRYIKKYREV